MNKSANTKVGDYFNINIPRAQLRAQVNFDPISGPMLICAFYMTQANEKRERIKKKKNKKTKPIPKKSNHFLWARFHRVEHMKKSKVERERERKRGKNGGNKNENLKRQNIVDRSA